jgi:hypothetical protein
MYEYLATAPISIPAILVLYLMVGAVWSLFRWVLLLRKKIRGALSVKALVYNRYKLDSEMPLEKAVLFLVDLGKEGGESEPSPYLPNGARVVGTVGLLRRKAFGESEGEPEAQSLAALNEHTKVSIKALMQIEKPPSPANYKGDIFSWIALWPASMLWYVVNEPVRKVYHWLRATYQRIADSMWKSVT